MGNGQSIYIYSVTDPRAISLDKLQKISDINNRKVWRNSNTGLEYEELNVSKNQIKSFQLQLVLYERRRQQEICLPEVHYVQNIDISSCLSESDQEFKVFVEFLPIRLSQITTIPLSSRLYFLKKAFGAFAGLFKQSGFFDIKQEFVGINKDGQPRFWFNSSWAVNEPESISRKSGNLTYLEGLMVEKIFEIIQLHIDNEDVHSYNKEKQKIKEWTFQLASAFLQYFVKSEGINLPNRITYQERRHSSTDLESISKSQTTRKQFSLKNPSYSIMLNLASPTPSSPTNRLSASAKNMFKSTYQKTEKTQQVNSKKDNSPISNHQSKFNNFSFKDSICIRPRNKTVRNDNSITKSFLCLSKFGNKANNTSYQGSKLSQRVQNLKQSKHQRDKSLVVNRRKHSQFNINFSKNSQTYPDKNSQIATQNAQEGQSITSSFIHKFRDTKDKYNKNFMKKSSMKQPHKCQLGLVRGREDTYYSNKLAPNQCFSPLAPNQCFSPLAQNKVSIKNAFSQAVNGIFLNQELSNFNQIKQEKPSYFARILSTKQSDVSASQFNVRISDFCMEDEKPEGKSAVMTQSIVLDELVIQTNKNDKPLGMLDQLMMKKVIERMQSERNQQQQICMKNPKVLAQSIIEPY